MGVRQFQGFLLGYPLPAESVIAWLENRPGLTDRIAGPLANDLLALSRATGERATQSVPAPGVPPEQSPPSRAAE